MTFLSEGTVCTGLTAVWCPVHGDCTCDEDVLTALYGPGPGDYERCPLHSPFSDHAEGVT